MYFAAKNLRSWVFLFLVAYLGKIEFVAFSQETIKPLTQMTPGKNTQIDVHQKPKEDKKPHKEVKTKTKDDNKKALVGDAAKGKIIFSKYCTPCHGDNADGAGALAESLPVKPRNFKKDTLHWGNSKRSVVETISYGRGDVMPAFQGAMPDQDIADVAEYIWSIVPDEHKGVSPKKQGFSKTHIISQKNQTFSPPLVTIQAGDSILVVNDDKVSHDVHVSATEPKGTAEPQGMKNSPGAKQRVQQPGDWDRFLFPDKGVFELRCRMHPKMKLMVTVK